MPVHTTITKPRRRNGVAGQVSYTTTATHTSTDQQDPWGPTEGTPVTFVGFPHETPAAAVVMITNNGHQVFVREAGRFGIPFGAEWVARFFDATVQK